MTRSTRSGAHDLSLAIVLCSFLAMVYLLFFCGRFTSIDEYAMYAHTESLAQGNGQNAPQLDFAATHNPVGRLEPGQPWLAVPLYLIAQQIPSASNIAAVMLFNVLITALTGGILYLLLRRLSFSQLISVGTVLAWGLGTMAWPYARSFYREPLNSLIWVTAATLCVAFSQTSKILYALACIAVLCVGLVSKSSSAAAVPVFLLTFLWDSNARRFTLGWQRVILLVVAALVTFGFGTQLNSMGLAKAIPALADYTWNYPFKDALLRAYGALFSPVKGLIFYSPILLATVVGWPRLVKRHGLVAFLILGVTLSLLYIYGGSAPGDAWHGGRVGWGPRYHTPLLALLLLPYASALSIRSVVARIWVGVWSIAGLVVQLAVGTASYSYAVLNSLPAFRDQLLVGLDGIPWYSWKLLPLSPAVVQILQWQPRWLDLIWLRALADGTLAWDKYLALLLLTLTGLALLALLLIVAKRRGAIRYAKWIAVGCVLLVLAGSAGLLLRSGRDTNDQYGLARADARQMAEVVNSSGQMPFTVAFVSNDFFSSYWLGLLKGKFVTQWYSPYDQTGPATVVTQATQARTIWLVIDRVHMPPDAKPYLAREMLAQQAYEVSEQWVGDFQLFEFLPQEVMLAAGKSGLPFRSGRVTNGHYGLTRTDARQVAQAASASGQTPYTVVLVSIDYYKDYWIGLLKGQYTTQWYSPNDQAGLATVVAQAPDVHSIWLAIDRAHMPPGANPYLARQMLAQQAYEVAGQWVGDFELFEFIPPSPMVQIPVRRSWTDGVQISAMATDTRHLYPGDALRLDMEFSTLEPLEQDYSLFAHLVPVEGAVISGRDGEPWYGEAPTSTWKPKETVIRERRGIRVPLDAKPGVYQIVCGWLSPDGVRLMPTGGQGPTVDGGIVLGTIEVLAD